MSARQHGAVALGGRQQLGVTEFVVYPVALLDVQHGGILPGLFTHHIRVLLPARGRGILLPCDALFLRRVGQQFITVAGEPALNVYSNEGDNGK